MSNDPEHDYQRMLEARLPDNAFLTAKDRRRLKQPVTQAQPHNIFTSHLSKHTIYEDETDRKLIRKGVFLRPVGLTPDARLSETQIAAEENRLGVRLPQPWRDVYTHFNGGWTCSLYWGDMNAPRMNDPEAIPHSGHEYLALEDVGPLRELMGKQTAGADWEPDWDQEGADWQRLDPRLIAIACRNGEAMVLDYRNGDDPKVWYAFFSRYTDDPVADWEQDSFTRSWPNMTVFFRGLYLQDRII